MDIVYLNQYKTSIIYNTLVSMYMMYNYIFNISVYTGHRPMLYFMTAYEVYDIFEEYIERHSLSTKVFIINMLHHISAACVGYLILINNNTIEVQYLQYGFMYIPTSTFFLNMTGIYPEQPIWKPLFALYFIWIRVIMQYSSSMHLIKHILWISPFSSNTLYPNIIATLAFFFHMLNLYWSALLVKKAVKMLK